VRVREGRSSEVLSRNHSRGQLQRIRSSSSSQGVRKGFAGEAIEPAAARKEMRGKAGGAGFRF